MCIPLVLLVILVDTLVAAFGTDAPTTLSSPIRQRRLLESVSSEVVVINMDWSPVEKKNSRRSAPRHPPFSILRAASHLPLEYTPTRS